MTATAANGGGRRLFGTDGVRGLANREPMTADTALKLGRAAGALFRRPGSAARVVIGKDTRLSGYMLEPAITAGLVSTGMNVILTGPMPTPAVAFLTRSLRADLGVMISASHNPYADNGIKLFGPDGYKLSDALELEIERRVERNGPDGLAAPAELGRARRIEDARGRYVENLKSSLPRGLRLEGLRLVVDAAHGAAYHLAADVFWELGADIVRLGDAPNGFNINDGCGSTAPDAMARAVVEHRADMGLALDGDADRVILVDERGAVVDGDQLLALIARSWLETGRLGGGAVAATVMSNLGLERFLAGLGLGLVRTKVGDRYVLEAMRARGLNLGGEPSGHVILSDYATTGDGLLAALQALCVLRAADRPMSEVARVFPPVPQRLVNLPMPRPIDLGAPALRAAVAVEEARLGARGRILVRPSGTEPLIRLMVEAEDPALLESVVAELRGALERAAA